MSRSSLACQLRPSTAQSCGDISRGLWRVWNLPKKVAEVRHGSRHPLSCPSVFRRISRLMLYLWLDLEKQLLSCNAQIVLRPPTAGTNSHPCFSHPQWTEPSCFIVTVWLSLSRIVLPLCSVPHPQLGFVCMPDPKSESSWQFPVPCWSLPSAVEL